MSEIGQRLADAEARRRAGDVNAAIAIAQDALQLAESQGDEAAAALVHLDLGNLLRYRPDALQAIRHLQRAELFYRTQPGDIRLARATTRQGMVLGDMGDHTRALDLYREALGLIESIGDGDAREEANCLGAVGVACTQLDDFEQAEAAYRRAIPLFEQVGAHESIVFIHNNLAILRVRSLERLTQDSDRRAALAAEAQALIDEGFARNETTQSLFASAALHNTRGDLYVVLDDHMQAVKSIEQALAVYRHMQLPRGEVDSLTNLGDACLKLGRADLALTHLHAANDIIAQHELKDHERALLKLLAAASEAQGDLAAALGYFKRYHALEIDTHRLDTQKKLQQLALRTEIDKAMTEASAARERSALLDRMAHEDALTGVGNRRHLDEWTAGQPLLIAAGTAVVLLDIDHFKHINDRFSHATGDGVLRELGVLLRSHARAGDLVARYGGEEFVMVLPAVQATHLAELIERLRGAVQAHAWGDLASDLAVTASFGVAMADGQQPFDALMRAADAALYRAKAGGRNRALMAT